jgi:hypothetical protein
VVFAEDLAAAGFVVLDLFEPHTCAVLCSRAAWGVVVAQLQKLERRSLFPHFHTGNVERVSQK